MYPLELKSLGSRIKKRFGISRGGANECGCASWIRTRFSSLLAGWDLKSMTHVHAVAIIIIIFGQEQFCLFNLAGGSVL